MTQEKILVTKEVWKEIIDSFGPFSTVHLNIAGHEIDLQANYSRKTMKVSILVFIDGWIKGTENEDLKKMFWNEKKTAKYDKKLKTSLIKIYGKKKISIQHPDINDMLSYYVWYFETMISLKNQYSKRHKEIYWIKDV